MATLYRKYRPQTFAEAVGQNHIKLTIQSELATAKIAHAYLFCGPRAVGKTTFARLVAKAVNCLNRQEGDFEPCDKCESCQDIVLGRALDIVEIDAASNTGVDNVRDNIIASARVSPSKSKYKVFIIDEVHMLSISAFNALLKILEEPPKRVVFILCTTETHKVPTTIISRCERFDFKRIGLADIVKKLSHIVREEKVKVDKEILEAIARQSEGHMRDAEGLLGQLVAISGSEITREQADLVIPRSDMGEIVRLIEFLAKKDAGSGIALVNKLLDDGVDLEKFTGDLIELLRRLMIAKINPTLGEKIGLEIGESYELRINEIKKDLPVERITVALEKLLLSLREMKNAFITQLPLEMAIAELCFESPRLVAPVAAASFRPAVASPLPPTGKIVPPSAAKNENLPPPVFSNANDNADVSLQDFSARWKEFLVKIKKYNHSLSFVLRTCQPRNLNGNMVCLAFKYKFHKDRVEEGKMREIIQNTLREVYGSNLLFEAVIDETLELDAIPAEGGTETGSPNYNSLPSSSEAVLSEDGGVPQASNDAMSNLLKAFGGKIVG